MVKVDKNKCIGCGACVAVCDQVFEMKNGKSSVKKGQEKSKIPSVKEAADACPVNAITPWFINTNKVFCKCYPLMH